MEPAHLPRGRPQPRRLGPGVPRRRRLPGAAHAARPSCPCTSRARGRVLQRGATRADAGPRCTSRSARPLRPADGEDARRSARASKPRSRPWPTSRPPTGGRPAGGPPRATRPRSPVPTRRRGAGPGRSTRGAGGAPSTAGPADATTTHSLNDPGGPDHRDRSETGCRGAESHTDPAPPCCTLSQVAPGQTRAMALPSSRKRPGCDRQSSVIAVPCDRSPDPN